MTTLKQVHDDVQELTGAVKEQGKQIKTQSGQINKLTTRVAGLSTHVETVREDFKEFRVSTREMDGRLIAAETKLEERTEPIGRPPTQPVPNQPAVIQETTPQPGAVQSQIIEATVNVLNAKAKIYIALAGAIGIAITAFAAWLAT
jgi:chromosome segregation ATPase